MEKEKGEPTKVGDVTVTIHPSSEVDRSPPPNPEFSVPCYLVLILWDDQSKHSIFSFDHALPTQHLV